MNEKILSLFGLARRAGRLAPGHDAVVESIVKNRAKLCVLCLEASERLEREIRHACSYEGKNIPVIRAGFSTGELSKAIGTKAAVISVNDEGFSKKLLSMLEQEIQRKE